MVFTLARTGSALRIAENEGTCGKGGGGEGLASAPQTQEKKTNKESRNRNGLGTGLVDATATGKRIIEHVQKHPKDRVPSCLGHPSRVHGCDSRFGLVVDTVPRAPSDKPSMLTVLLLKNPDGPPT